MPIVGSCLKYWADGPRQPESQGSDNDERGIEVSLEEDLHFDAVFILTPSPAYPELVLLGIVEKGVHERIPHPFPDVAVHVEKSPRVG